ncbi:MAG: PAS domain S-box protein [Bacteroidetes bacterium]|nr:PAS domain S-box protein [Bacteroidota bacterium]
MNLLSSFGKRIPDYFSVVKNNLADINLNLNLSADLIIHTSIDFQATYFNESAKIVFNCTDEEIPSINLLDIDDIKIVGWSVEDVKADLFKTGFWEGHATYQHYVGKTLEYKVTITLVSDSSNKPLYFVIVCNNLEAFARKELELAAADKKFNGLLNALSSGVMLMDTKGKILLCNKNATEILGITEEYLLVEGSLNSKTWKGIKPDGTPFPIEQYPALVSLQTGFPQRNVVMGFEKEDGQMNWVSINTEALIHLGEFSPYAVVVSMTDITQFVLAEHELTISNERFDYAAKVTSDAIWDFDLKKNEIYRSETFVKLSGYASEHIGKSLDWSMSKIHPEDVERVKDSLDKALLAKNERWQDEYRFIYADGTYKIIKDSAIILYEQDQPVRMIGAIKDITEARRMKQQLIDEQAKAQKNIALAVLQAQEREKLNISSELHDNVNQIILSAKLYMETAKQTPENADKLLEKAIEYQMLAMHEIRKLSHSLNTLSVRSSSLHENIVNVVHNLEAFKNIKVNVGIDSEIEKQLTETVKLHLYRIIQEQSNNIIKYADASLVSILLERNGNMNVLIVSDNGKGFDTAKQDNVGIGLINMNNRAIAIGGKIIIQSAPSEGCVLKVEFP